MISLINAAKYYKALPHQDEAWDYLLTLISTEELEQFAKLYRTEPKPTVVSKPKTKNILSVKVESQRDYKYNDGKDGTHDRYQTCNVHSVSAVISYMTGKYASPKALDDYIKNNSGSRYSHASLAKALQANGVISTFSTATKTQSIIDSILAGRPVIWSNKLTHGGHIVVVCGVDLDNKFFVIADPYGQPYGKPGAWQYKDVRGNYRLSFDAFQKSGMNGPSATGHWCHLLTKA